VAPTNKVGVVRPEKKKPAKIEMPESAIREQDRILAQGFDDLVGDLELEDSQQLLEAIAHDDEFIEHTKAPDLQIKTVCTAKLKWPPSDGEHRLKCGGMVLVVRVKAGR
jgi:hypothetical protein